MHQKVIFAFLTASTVLTLRLVDCLPPRPLAKQCQPISEYYDPVTSACEPCAEICEFSRIKRTEKECETQCQDYVLASTCTSDQYYDTVVRQCAPCSELCDNFLLKKTRDQCFSQCPGYPSTPGASNSTDRPEGSTSSGEGGPLGTPDSGRVVAIIIVAFALIAVVATLVMIFTAKCWARNDRTCCGRSDQGSYAPVIGEGYLPVQEKTSMPPVSMPIPCTNAELKEHEMTASVTRFAPG